MRAALILADANETASVLAAADPISGALIWAAAGVSTCPWQGRVCACVLTCVAGARAAYLRLLGIPAACVASLLMHPRTPTFTCLLLLPPLPHPAGFEDCWGLATLPADGVVVAASATEGALHVHSLATGARLASVSVPHPTFLAADKQRGASRVYASVFTADDGRARVRAFRWDGSLGTLVDEGVVAAAGAAHFHRPLAVMPPPMGAAVEVPEGGFGHGRGRSNSTGDSGSPAHPVPASALIVGIQDGHCIRVIALPPPSTGSHSPGAHPPPAPTLAYSHDLGPDTELVGLGAAPCGTALVVLDGASAATHVTAWPPPGRLPCVWPPPHSAATAAAATGSMPHPDDTAEAAAASGAGRGART